MKFLDIKNLRELIEKPQKIIESDIKEYLVYLRKERKISYVTANTYLVPIRKFYYVNSDFQFKWDLITSYLGNDDTDDDDELEREGVEGGEDRPYSKEEIKIMSNSAQDIRVKILISLLSSSGLRYGAIPGLKLKHLEKIEKYQLYQITAYGKSKKYSYKTFCTPECTSLIDSYLSYRKKQGEQLKDNSPLIREQFNTIDKLKVNNPRHLTLMTFRDMINNVLTKYSTLRKKIPFDYENKRKEGRNSTMLTHAFRKFFNTECAKAGVYPDFIEIMLGHKLPGVRSHYMKPDTHTLLEGTKEVKGYLAAINSLTINDENRLSKQLRELKEKNEDAEYIIKAKLKEKDEQIHELKKKDRVKEDALANLSDQLMYLSERIQQLERNSK
jgi:integrase